MDKTEAYCDLLKMFAKVVDPRYKTKLDKNPQARKNLGNEMMLVGMNIALLGSDDVVQNYIDWRAAAQSGDTERIVREFSVLMLSMRKDLRDTEIGNYNRMTDMYIEVV